MNIIEVKKQLGYEVLNLNTALDADGKKTDWMRHWDNTNRVAVSVHKDTVAAIKANPNTNLGLQEEVRTGEKGDYKAMRIVMFTPSEEQL